MNYRRLLRVVSVIAFLWLCPLAKAGDWGISLHLGFPLGFYDGYYGSYLYPNYYGYGAGVCGPYRVPWYGGSYYYPRYYDYYSYPEYYPRHYYRPRYYYREHYYYPREYYYPRHYYRPRIDYDYYYRDYRHHSRGHYRDGNRHRYDRDRRDRDLYDRPRDRHNNRPKESLRHDRGHDKRRIDQKLERRERYDSRVRVQDQPRRILPRETVGKAAVREPRTFSKDIRRSNPNYSRDSHRSHQERK